MNDKEVNEIVTKCAASFGLEAALIFAIIQTESSGTWDALKYEPGYKWIMSMDTVKEMAAKNNISPETELVCEQISWGMCQLMGATARQLGFKERLTTLLVPATGIFWGCKFLKTLMDKYKKTEDAVAAYNAGSVIIRNGQYKNQEYVDKVMSFYKNYKAVGL